MAALISEVAEIRKLRKKLRQIENLERLTRPLDELEQIKVEKKYDVRQHLQDLLDRVDNSTSTGTHPISERTPSSSPRPLEEEAEEETVQNEPGVEVEEGGMETAGSISSLNREKAQVKDQGDVKRTLLAAEIHESFKSQSGGDRPADKTSKKGKKGEAQGARGNPWQQRSVLVSELDGHSDLVTSVRVQGTTLVSASRDTTVRVWDLETGEEINSLGGHTETVTSVLILSPEETAFLKAEEDAKQEDSYIVSGSTDCTFKVWSLKSGKLVKSVYTFNPVTCLDYSPFSHLLVTASDGGKIELWNIKTTTNVLSARAHGDAVTAVKVLNNTVITADAEGFVMVHEIRDGSLVCVFVSEDVRVVGTGRVNHRTIRCLTASDKLVVFGDDAVNLKLLDWKKGVVRKVVNHVSEFTSTDAVCLWEDVLLSSSYDLDTGYGYINIRSLSSGEYLASLDDEDEAGTERIMCLAATRLSSGHAVLVSGGLQLKLWHLLPPGQSAAADLSEQDEEEEKWVTLTQFLPALAQTAGDSDTESDGEEEEEDTEEEEEDGTRGGGKGQGDEGSETGSWLSWCSIV